MKVSMYLAGAYKLAQFVESALELPNVVAIEPPLPELSRESRQVLADLPNKTQGSWGYIPVLSLEGHPEFTAPFLPQNAEEWDQLLSLYNTEKKRRVAQRDAAAQQEARQNFERLVTQVEEREARLMENENAYGPQVDVSSGYMRDRITAIRKWNIEGLDALISRANTIDAAAAERALAAEERDKVHDAQAQAEKEAARALAQAVRLAWIQEHGSEYLRKACNAGYNCQRMYVTERAALERPGYIVDFDNNANWKSRACPSEAALDESLRVEGQVVWLTQTPGRGTEDKQNEDEYEVYSECEAVVIRGYLGNYDLLRLM